MRLASTDLPTRAVRRWLPYLALTLLGVALLAEEVGAQAGGGGSYGSGGGGGGGGDGDGFGFLIYLLIRLAIEKPLIGVPVLIVALVVIHKSQKGGRKRLRGRVIRRGRSAREEGRGRAMTEDLKERDPDFDSARFLKRVESAFRVAQDSWCAQDLTPLRHFVSDGIYERFSLQIAEQKEDGWRQGMSGLSIVGAPSIVFGSSDSHFDTLTVRIAFQADIHRIALKSGKKIAGSDLPETHLIECWSFIRRRGAKTPSNEGLIEGHCPNCAAPLAMSTSAVCSSCKSLIRSGEYDWVLAEITQASEWRAEDTARVPGLVAYQDSDPEMNVQALEDRVSVMFWREAAAARAASVDPLQKVASERMRAEYQKSFDREKKSYMGDRAVGSVETLGILAGEEVDRVVVEVRWDGRRIGRDGEKARSPASRRIMTRSLFVLVRKAGSRTEIEKAFASAHCGSCGAPDENLKSADCAFCGEPLNRGGEEWLLDAILGVHDEEWRRLKEEIRGLGSNGRGGSSAPPDHAGVLRWTLQMAHADGSFDPKEQEAIRQLAARSDVTSERLSVLIDEAKRGESELPAPADSAEATRWLRHMLELALADGKITRSERRYLDKAASAAGVSAKELRRMEEEAHLALYRETRRADKRGS